MYCNNCQKEIEGEFLFCPHCGNSIQQEVVSNEGEHDYTEAEYKEKIRIATKKLYEIQMEKQKYRDSIVKKRRKAWKYIFLIILSGCLCLGLLGIVKYEEYEQKINELRQEQKIKLSEYEAEFSKAILKRREEREKSCLVSTENKNEVNEYIKSLYRYSGAKIEKDSFNNKSYYLIKDYKTWDKYNISDSTNDTIYPGAILKGDSLFKENYTVISAERTPIELMSNQSNGRIKMVTNPNYSNVTKKLNEYADEYIGDVSKEWKYEIASASSTHELNTKLGAGVGKHSVGVNTEFDNEKNKIAVVYSQIYYTISVEPKNNASDYFKNGVDLKLLGGYEPAYVSSVDYGRKFILTVESELSESDLRTEVKTCIKGVDIEADIENINKNNDLDWNVESYGGEQIKLEKSDLKNGFSIQETFNDTLNDDNKLINPIPISYNLKYLSDNTPVPVMYIYSDKVMLAEDTQIITLSSQDNEVFQIDITALPAILYNKDEVIVENGKARGRKFELLCRDMESIPIEILYGNVMYSVDLASCCGMEETFSYEVSIKFLGSEITLDYIDIYKTKYLKHYIQE